MIKIIACGKVKDAWLKEGIAEYEKRMRTFSKLEIIEVSDEKASEKLSEAQKKQVIDVEGERLLKHIKDDDYVILLDLKGKQLSSEELAKKIETLEVSGKSTIDFVIGGSLGVSEVLQKRSDYQWQLSNCTFPHLLCRLIVIEQIYRAFTIRKNTPYHK